MAKTKSREQFEKEYGKVYRRIQKYIKRFSEIGWEIPKRLVPPAEEKANKEHLEKFKDIKIKEFRKKLKKIQSEEVGKYHTGKKAQKIGAEREKEWRAEHQQQKEQDDVPYFGFVMELKSRLNSLPSGKWVRASDGGKMYYEFTDKANLLISIVDDNLNNPNYINYLNNNSESIINEIDKWEMFDSEQHDLEYSFIGLFNLLDYEKLYDISKVAEELSLMGDYYNSN